MIATIVYKELRVHLLSGRSLGCVLVFMTLALSATALRIATYQRLLAHHEHLMVQRELVKAKTVGMWDRMMLGYDADKRPNPLSIFAYGLEDEITRTLRYTEWSPERILARKLDSFLLRINYVFDLLTIVTVVGSLAALMVAFDSVGREREDGTLRLLLSGPLPRDAIIIGKVAAASLVLIVPLAIAWALSAAMAMLFGVTFTAAELTRLGLLAGLSALYLLVFAAMGVALSVWTRNSSGSLAACLLAWMVLVVSVPGILPRVAAAIATTPRRADIENSFNAAWESRYRQADSSMANRIVTVRDRIDAEKEMHQNADTDLQLTLFAAGREFRNTMRRQRDATMALLSLSPAAAFTYAGSDLAGTGVDSYYALQDYWTDFKPGIRAVQWDWGDGRPGVRLPRFQPPAVPVRRLVRDHAAAAAVLGGFFILLTLLATLSFVRHEV